MENAQTDGPILDVENLSVNFGGFKAVDGFSMSLARGELRVLIGPNGAGKTTTLDAISGKIRATEGTIRFGGRPITNWQEHQIARSGVGRKFQIPSVFKDLTVWENLEVASSREISVRRNLMLRVGHMVDRRIETVLEMIKLGDEANNLAGNLSHGESQWLELGMVLVQNPQLILLDEPTAGFRTLDL
jgi:urea transport system ATP-binding protein